VEFPRGYRPSSEWLAEWTHQHPELSNKRLLMMPGRLTRWKGQEDFIALIASLKAAGEPAHGLIVGGAHPKKAAFADELRALAARQGVSDQVTFLGHRNDIREIMAVADVVFSLSRDPEAFGRVSLEALALGRPVIGYGHGGVAEQLRACFPKGLVSPGDFAGLVETTRRLLKGSELPLAVTPPFTLEAMCLATISVYQECCLSP
jgi:glycosyltransferase involved in cell wall biosynthesis